MRRPLALLAVLLPLAARSQEGAMGGAPTGITATADLGAGGELGLPQGEKAGIFELEAAIGYEFAEIGLRPELALAFGLAPDTNFAIRPGARLDLPGLPIQLRASFDASNSRGDGLRWRWLLLGAAAEVRLTGLFGLFGEVDTGVKLNSQAGLPLIFRAGASFRF